MTLTNRETWTLIHGLVIGSLFLLAFAGGLAGLWSLRGGLVTSAGIRERVIRARQRQLERFQGEKVYSNAQLSPRMIRKYCQISPESERLLESAMTRLGLSARAHDRILKVSRTIADLDGAENISSTHISEAIQYRSLDRNYWT